MQTLGEENSICIKDSGDKGFHAIYNEMHFSLFPFLHKKHREMGKIYGSNAIMGYEENWVQGLRLEHISRKCLMALKAITKGIETFRFGLEAVQRNPGKSPPLSLSKIFPWILAAALRCFFLFLEIIYA